ncbi:hypothetical protein BgiBS90_035851 [Biomphalaria glabrata]|nr:hypothetical protein BgiBS90_035851 [Biomphalaria glabrata]
MISKLFLVIFCTLFWKSLGQHDTEDMLAFCPAGFRPQGDQCFREIGRGNRDTARNKCRALDAIVPEIHTWEQQTNLEIFMKEEKINNPVWLNGELSETSHREGSIKFYWPSRFFPRLSNFKEMPLKLFDPIGDCVYISPRENFFWKQASCKNSIQIICVNSLRKIASMYRKRG